MDATEYRRTPLPDHARTRVGWIALYSMCLIFSPFVGFAIHGKVEAPGLVIGLLIAVFPLCGLITIAISRWLAWRRLPTHLVKEWTTGRVIPAEGAPMVVSPVRFYCRKNWIDIMPEGVNLSRHALLTMQDVPDFMAKVWIAEQTQELFVSWSDIVEWAVDTDSDGPNYYLLKLRPKGALKVRRFKPDTATECDLLDAVRSVGKVPVRLLDDLDCKSALKNQA
jgi:hypothetical protein